MNLLDTAIVSILSIETYRCLQIEQVEGRFGGIQKAAFLQHFQQSNLSCFYAPHNSYSRMHRVVTDPHLCFEHRSREQIEICPIPP